MKIYSYLRTIDSFVVYADYTMMQATNDNERIRPCLQF